MGHCLSENFAVPDLCLQIGIGKYFMRNLLGFIDSDVEKLSTGDEVNRNTPVTVNQVIAKRRQYRQIWCVNNCVMLQFNYMQLKRLEAMKDSTPGLNNDLVITIT